MSKEKLNRSESLEQRVKKLEKKLEQYVEPPHVCFTCKHFILRKEKPRNRVCRYPGELVIKGKTCQCWSLEPNPRNRVWRIA